MKRGRDGVSGEWVCATEADATQPDDTQLVALVVVLRVGMVMRVEVVVTTKRQKWVGGDYQRGTSSQLGSQ